MTTSSALLALAAPLTLLVTRSLAHTLKEVIDIFTGTQQSAARVHEGHTKTIVKNFPLPPPTFPTSTIVSHTSRSCLFLLFVRHFMENKHIRAHRKCAATAPKGNPVLHTSARLANYLEIIGLDRGYMTCWCTSKKINPIRCTGIACNAIKLT